MPVDNVFELEKTAVGKQPYAATLDDLGLMPNLNSFCDFAR